MCLKILPFFLFFSVCFSGVYYVECKNGNIDVQISDIQSKIANSRDKSNVIEFSPGIHKLNKMIKFRLARGSSIQLKGHGVGITTLLWNANSTSQGIVIEFHANGSLAGLKGGINVQNMSLINDSTVKDSSALSLINYAAGGGAETPTKNVHDIGIAGSSKPKHWGYGVVLDGCNFTNVDRISYNGSNSSEGTAILIKGKMNQVDNYITQLRVTEANNGIHVQGNTEGVYINQITMIAVKNGIYWNTDSFEPFLSVSNSHINAVVNCILAENILQAIITDNLFYQLSRVEDKNPEWSAIKIDGKSSTFFDLTVISNNVIHGFDRKSKKVIGINLQKRQNSIVSNNVIFKAHVGILGGDTKNITLDNNLFLDVKRNTVKVKR